MVSECGDKPWPAASCSCYLQNTCNNLPCLSGNLCALTVASSRYDILICCNTLVSDMHHVSELLVPGFGCHVLLCLGWMPRNLGISAYVRDGYEAVCQPKFECGCCEKLFFRVYGMKQNFYVFSLHINPDHDRIFY